jgi:hypothetical protein
VLGGLVHFELLPLAEIILFLVFVLLFVKGSIGFVGHLDQELMSKRLRHWGEGRLKTTPQGSKIRELVAVELGAFPFLRVREKRQLGHRSRLRAQ